MRMKVENYNELSAAILQGRKNNTDLVQASHVLEFQYAKNNELSDIERAQYRYLVLTFMTEGNLEDAMYKASDKASMYNASAEKLIVEALNAAPASWLKTHRDEFYKKGVIFGLDRCYKARLEEMPGSLFDQIYQRVPARYNDIALAAIDCSHTHKNRFGWRVQDRIVSYVFAQLMEDGDKKNEILDILDRGKRGQGATPHNKALNISATGIDRITKVLGFDPKDLPTINNGESVPKRVTQPSALKVALTKAADGKNPETAEPESELTKITRRLTVMAIKGTITDREKEIYLFAITPRGERGLPSEFETVSRFTKRFGSSSSQSETLSYDLLRKILKEIPDKLAKFDDSTIQNGFILAR